MKKPFFFFLAICLAFGGLLQGCDGEVGPDPTATSTSTPTINARESVLTPTTSPDFSSGTVVQPPFYPLPSLTPLQAVKQVQAPKNFHQDNPASKTLVIFILDTSSSMKACDPDFAKSQSMMGAIVRMMRQYYLPSEFIYPSLPAPDVLFLKYPNPDSVVTPASLYPSPENPTPGLGVLESIFSAKIGGSEIFYASMLKKIGQISAEGEYDKTIVLHWTDGVFTPGEWADNPIESREQYQKETDTALNNLPSDVELNIFFPCQISDSDSQQWWNSKSQIHLYPLLSSDVYADWLLPLREQGWFQTIFPGLGSQSAWQKWFVFANGVWHDLSAPKVDTSCPTEKCMFTSSPTTTGFVAGIIPLERKLNDVSFGLPDFVRDGQSWHLERPDLFAKDEVFPASECSPHQWGLFQPTRDDIPFLFFWKGANDLQNHIEITNSPASIVIGDLQAPSSMLEVNWTAEHTLKQNPSARFLTPDALKKWEPCYVLSAEAYGQILNGAWQSSNSKQVWQLSVQEIIERLALRTQPVLGGNVELQFLLRYTGEDGSPSEPNDHSLILDMPVPVQYSSQIINTSLPCQKESVSALGATDNGAKAQWRCNFFLSYAAPEFRSGKPPMKIWFDYAAGSDLSMCWASDSSSAENITGPFARSDSLLVVESMRSQDQTQSVFEVISICQPTALHLEVEPGIWNVSPFVLSQPVQNPLNP